MKKDPKKQVSPSEGTVEQIVNDYGYSNETARILVATKGEIDELTYLELLKSDKAFEADQIGQKMFNNPELATEALQKDGINVEQMELRMWNKVQEKIKGNRPSIS